VAVYVAQADGLPHVLQLDAVDGVHQPRAAAVHRFVSHGARVDRQPEPSLGVAFDGQPRVCILSEGQHFIVVVSELFAGLKRAALCLRASRNRSFRTRAGCWSACISSCEAGAGVTSNTRS